FRRALRAGTPTLHLIERPYIRVRVAVHPVFQAWKSVPRFASDGRRFVPGVIGIARYEYLTHLARSLPHQSLDKLADEGQPCHQLADSSRPRKMQQLAAASWRCRCRAEAAPSASAGSTAAAGAGGDV